MIGRDFFKRLRLLNGRTETIKTRFELNQAGQLVEHVTLQTFDRPALARYVPPVGEPQSHHGRQ